MVPMQDADATQHVHTRAQFRSFATKWSLAERLAAGRLAPDANRQSSRSSMPSDPHGERENGATVIVIASPKGGVGKSTIAAHLATGLARFHNLNTVLLDANLEFGDQA